MNSSQTRDIENSCSRSESHVPLLSQVLSNQYELQKILLNMDSRAHTAQSTTSSTTNASRSVMKVEASILKSRERRCPVGCRCTCHVKKCSSSSRTMQHIIGLLFIGYSGRSHFASRIQCDCYAQSLNKAKVCYLFPNWLVSRAIHIVFESSAYHGIQLSLQSRNILPFGTKVFHLAVLGDIEGLQELFAKGHASPYDSTPEGWTALQVRTIASLSALVHPGLASDYGHILCLYFKLILSIR